SLPPPRGAGGRGRGPPRGPQLCQELAQGGHLGRADLLAVGRHVAAARGAVADLVDQLVAGQARADRRQVGTAPAAAAVQGVAVATALALEDGGALEPDRRAFAGPALRDRV